jgi:hypothetical protein
MIVDDYNLNFLHRLPVKQTTTATAAAKTLICALMVVVVMRRMVMFLLLLTTITRIVVVANTTRPRICSNRGSPVSVVQDDMLSTQFRMRGDEKVVLVNMHVALDLTATHRYDCVPKRS